jgi:dTDP-4-amino-4,6-dideoxygalactose transaminase
MKPIPIETAHWRAAEFGAVWRALTLRAASGNPAQRLEAEASRLIGGAPVLALNSGRGAMAIALRLLAARAPGRKRVLIPEYVCPSVPAALVRLALTPESVPVGEDLNLRRDAALAALDASVLAVVPVHMYGHLADVRAIAAAAGAQGVGVIDDAAHVIGVAGPSGAIPGTLGEFGFVSLAQSKTLSCGNSGSGGLLIVNSATFLGPAKGEVAALPRAPRSDLVRFALEERHIPPRDTLTWRIGDTYARLAPAPKFPLELNITRIAPAHAAIALGQIASLAERLADKRRIAAAYAEALSRIGRIEFPQFAPGRYLSRILLKTASLEERDRLRAHLAARGISSRTGYPPPNAPMAEGGCPRAFALLEVPSGFALPPEAIARVARAISEFYARRA